ncbi:hypothetical protein [Bacillus pumilus]|uniref:hypothetical protein n=1 Tax=Bacillus pumilus TaxID=1408 RepID=UPI00119FC6F8|nr:hypothetical protein [Bacillus pumilus]
MIEKQFLSDDVSRAKTKIDCVKELLYLAHQELKGLKSLNIEHPMVTQINSFGYPKDYWKDEAERDGYEEEDDEDK